MHHDASKAALFASQRLYAEIVTWPNTRYTQEHARTTSHTLTLVRTYLHRTIQRPHKVTITMLALEQAKHDRAFENALERGIRTNVAFH